MDIKFKCNGCGGCCLGGISLTYNEVINTHSGDFPVAVIFSVSDVRNVPIEKEKTPYAKSMKKHSKECLSFYSKSSDNRKIVVHPEFITLVGGEHGCPNLDWDNKCQIYSRRPKACSLYPYRVDTPVLHMVEGLRRERSRSFEMHGHRQSCQGFTEDKEVIFHRGKPVEEGITDTLHSRNEEASIGKAFLKEFFIHLLQDDDIQKKLTEYSELNKNDERVIQVSLAKFIRYMVKSKKISACVAEGVIERNKQALNRELSKLDCKTEEVMYDNCLTHISDHFS